LHSLSYLAEVRHPFRVDAILGTKLVPLLDLVPRQGDFSKEECRSWALKPLASMATLSRAERDRVLKQVIKVNAV
jgi:hypothetical protein